MKIRLKQLALAHKKGPVSICFGGKKLFHAQHHLAENGYEFFYD